eukprot:m.32037 g.32037  ORF g.32037 m.32037 type:complete len:718 (+) comp9359_c1_seq2:75-2228(+)
MGCTPSSPINSSSSPFCTNFTRADHIMAASVAAAVALPQCSTHAVVYGRDFTQAAAPGPAGPKYQGVDVFLTAPAGERAPSHVICVIDVSGSMREVASGGSDKSLEGSAFSCLDLVKHSLNTLVSAMQATDSLSLVSFNLAAKTVLFNEHMTDDGKENARRAVELLVAGGGTNIWGGLSKAMEIAKAHREKTKQPSTVVLLTDGQETASCVPPKGTNTVFADALAKLGPSTLSLHTLGYGYSVDSKLLTTLAQSGQGVLGFIPDATMVGTLFVNFLSTVFATRTSHLVASLHSDSSSKGAAVFALTNDANERDLGLLLHGQTRSIHLRAPPGWQGHVEFHAKLPSGPVFLAKQDIHVAEGGEVVAHSSPVYARELVGQALLGAGSEAALASVRKQLAQIAGLSREASEADKPYFDALMSDLHGDTPATGQIDKALTPVHFNKWGKHYLPGLALCHLMQVSQNFKDAALQGYGGSLFTQLQTTIEEIFCMLPPPKATGAVSGAYGGGYSGGGASHASHQPASMGTFYNRDGGCFHGQCRVQLHDGSLKAIADLRRGDCVRSRDGTYHPVDLVVISPQQVSEHGTITLVDVGGVLLTSFHPVFVNNRWSFPKDCGVQRDVTAACVYNVLLAPGATDMLVWAPATRATLTLTEGLACVTLAHGIEGDAVASHAFLGTSAVRDTFLNMRGWETGRVVVDEQRTLRDPLTNRICGLTELVAV